MQIMGVDLSSRSVAMVVDGDEPSGHKLAVSTKVMDRYAIGRVLYPQIVRHLSLVSPFAIYVEAPIVAGRRNLQSSLKIAQVCGVFIGAAASAGMERVYLVPPSSWKAEVIGNGNADKERIRSWLAANKPEISSLCGADQDLRDAACIAIYGQGLQQRVDGISRSILDDS